MRRALTLILLLLAGSLTAHAAGTYHLVKEIPIGGDGGWDYITVDHAAHRLYVSHATKVVVVDIDAGRVIGEIPDTPGVHGFAIAPDLGRGFSSNGRANTSTIVDLKTLEAIGSVHTEGNPDAIFYDPARKEVYTMNGTGKSATVFEAATGQVVATIPLGGKPEAVALETATHRLFVNLEDIAAIGVIDTNAHTLLATWPLTGCEEPTGLGFDPGTHRLFSACANKVMVVTDSATGRHVTSIPIGAGADGGTFDPGTGLAFASNGGDGTVTIAHLDNPNTLTVVQTLETAVSGRTMILDPVSHDIFVPAAETRPNPAGRGRAQPVTGTFKVLVYGMR
ncbi:MAG: YncE family protein [Vicinamibacterales bacterium]